MDVPRPFLTLHLFGSESSGKTSLKKQWFESSHCRVFSEIADVHIRLQRECTNDVLQSVYNSETPNYKHCDNSFVIIYRPDIQKTIAFAQECVHMIVKVYGTSSPPIITVIENHFEDTFKPHTDAPTQFPISTTHANGSAISVEPPQLWRVRINDGVSLVSLFDSIIITPILKTLDERTKSKLITLACHNGHLTVVKLLLRTMEESNFMSLLAQSMSSIESLLPEKTAKFTALTEVAKFAYNLDPTISMSTIVRLADKYPKASLHLLNDFCQQSDREEHFLMSGVALVTLPVYWVEHKRLMHVNISNNLLSSLPFELFQEPTICSLNLSHNCLASLPSVLKWNCPKLCDIDVSYNQLMDEPFSIYEGKKTHERVDRNPPNKPEQQLQISATQRTLRLTGYNLYPCLCSVRRVNISNNPTLSQIPEWVCVLPNLTLLEMKSLPRVTTLTPYLAHCRSLCVLQLDTEGLISPTQKEAQRGTRVIMAYLRCQLRGSTPYRHVRLVLLGSPESGKTTLFKQFMKGEVQDGNLTPHMDMGTFDYPKRAKSRKDRPKVTFHIIDFAGGEIYRSIHKSFLTYRSIYLCLWNIANGKESLEEVVPWLRSVQACVPGSPVLLVATHIDKRPGISGDTILQWEQDVFGEVDRLSNASISSKLGLPLIMQSVVMDCKNKDDVDHLANDVYEIALRMKQPRSMVPMLEELLPRSYQELQSLIEVKVRSLQRERQTTPVLRHGEFISYIQSLTLHNPNDIEKDDEEFALACQFLHDAGVIVHFRSNVPNISDLYCLDPQWLFNVLTSVINAVAQRQAENVIAPIISNEEIPSVFRRAKVPNHLFTSFLAMMESFDIVVSLDFERNTFLFPALLPISPPPQYPLYDLSTEDVNRVSQYVQLDYISPSFFPQLISRILLYVRQLSCQLLAVAVGSLSNEYELTGDEIYSRPTSSLSSSPSMSSTTSLLRLSHNFHVDHHGYMTLDDGDFAEDESLLRSRIWALSAANVAGTPQPTRRYKSITEKLVSLSQPILQRRTRTPSLISEDDQSLSHSDLFSTYTFWKNGLFVEFPCGTKFWLELCEKAVSIVIYGDLIPRVKALSFLSSCIDSLVEECYAGLNIISYSPCPPCLKKFWKSSYISDTADNSFATSTLEVSTTLIMNEFTEKIEYSIKPTSTDDQPRLFGGTRFSVEDSPSPPDSQKFDELPMIALLENELALFPLETTVHQAIISSSILCPKCHNRISLQLLSPHVLLVDFKDKFLLNSKKLSFSENDASKLGGGGFGKVFRGDYRDEPVAVKVFRKHYNNQVLLHRYKDLREELTIMSTLDHPRVVSLVGVCLKPLCIVLRLAPQGSLKDNLALCPQGMLSSVAHRLLFQIADGIRYLHSVYVVHRDIKPGNVLVWSLSPDYVDAKLTDYGVSQFYTPGGLRRHKGTEEYMAPELFRSHNNLTYDEKVDIFSFALILHYVVTGRKLFAGIANKREQIHRISNLHIPLLSSGLAESMSENKPLSSSSKFKHLLRNGKHPAARTDVITSCHSVCMQQLMVDCLSINPQERPSAQGVCSRLLVCPGSRPQANFFITSPVVHAGYSQETDFVVAIQQNSPHMNLLPTDTWGIQRLITPYSREPISCMTVIGKEVFMASSESNLVFSLQLPLLRSGHISPQPLQGTPLCMFVQKEPTGNSFKIIVGMSSGRVAIFSTPATRGHILESQPYVTQVITNPNPLKTAINCGTYHRSCVWCGCGRFLIGLDDRDYLMKVYRPVIRDEDTIVNIVTGSHEHIWIGFKDRSIIVICDSVKAQDQETLDCHAILSRSGIAAAKANVTAIASGHDLVWVGTKGGHLLSFNPLTADILLVHRREQSLSSILCLSDRQIVTFAKGIIGESSEEDIDGDMSGLFTVWTNYVNAD